MGVVCKRSGLKIFEVSETIDRQPDSDTAEVECDEGPIHTRSSLYCVRERHTFIAASTKEDVVSEGRSESISSANKTAPNQCLLQ